MIMKTPLRLAIPLVLAMSAAAVAQDDAVTAETVVATVNGEDITIGHMLVVRARLPQEYQQLEPQVLFDGILDQLIQQVALGQEAEALTVANQLILQNEERALLSSQVIADLAREASTDEAIQAAYDETFAEAGGETEYNASHILVATEEEAQAIVADLEAGGDFAEIAKEKSTGPSGPNGGALGWFGAGMMVPSFEEATFALEPGQVSAPVQTQFGWHVIVLNETRQTEAPPLEAVREELVEQVQRAAIEARVEELRAASTIVQPDLSAIDPNVLQDFSLIAE